MLPYHLISRPHDPLRKLGALFPPRPVTLLATLCCSKFHSKNIKSNKTFQSATISVELCSEFELFKVLKLLLVLPKRALWPTTMLNALSLLTYILHYHVCIHMARSNLWETITCHT